jgi:hypothetical protein
VALKDRLDLVAVAVGVVTGGVTFGIASVFGLYPNLQPITGREVLITQISLEPSVSFDDYQRHTTRRLVPTGPESCVSRIQGDLPSPREASSAELTELPPPAPAPGETGLAIHFAFTASGFRGECVVAEYVAFDGDKGTRLPQPISFSGSWETDLRDTDAGSGELWIPDSTIEQTRSMIVRVELYSYSESQIRRLTYLDTAKLCLPAAFECPPPSPGTLD